MTRQLQYIVTCEHGGAEIPKPYRSRFASARAQQVLRSHRGWDPGALEAARFLAGATDATLTYSLVSRLVVDLNRSPDHPELFSSFIHPLTGAEREAILRDHYRPYRNEVAARVRAHVEAHDIAVHLAVHTFTPVFRGVRRTVDIGLLYDPSRGNEDRFCRYWQTAMQRTFRSARIALNEPYRGIDDGLTTALRQGFPDDVYLGIELELNNRMRRRTADGRRRMLTRLAATLASTARDFLGST